MTDQDVIAIFNANPDAIELLAHVLSVAGFIVVSALIPDVRDGRVDLDEFLAAHDPSVIVFDVAPPYGRNWRFLERLRDMAAMRERRLIITSLNPRHVEDLTRGDEKVYEVVGKPYDLGLITQAVKEACRARSTRLADDRPAGDAILERRYMSERRQSSASDDKRPEGLPTATAREPRRAERRKLPLLRSRASKLG
jgi:CheY-like chemotaxis protein